LLLLLLCCVGVTVYAHFTGAFADFLITVQDEQTAAKLTEEMEKTKAEIAQLTPRVNKLESDYRGEQQIAVSQLQFYSELGLDTWMNLLLQSESLVDMMGSHWLFETNLNVYMEQLDSLYKEHMQLLTTKNTLEGHRRLLAMIEENMQMRKKFLAQNPNVPLDQLTNYLDIDWQSEVEAQLLKALKHDRELTEQQAPAWASAATDGSSYGFDESWLNGQSEVEYFFRSDHVYVIYKKNDIHVILIGQVLSGSGHTAELQFEAGFFNGFLMPDTLIQELPGFRISYDKLQGLPGVSPPIYLRQTGGALILQTGS
jgi:hypothetical protein